MIRSLLADLAQRGVELWTDGAQLRYRGPRHALTPEVLADVRARKAELLAELRAGWVSRTYPLSHPQRALWYLHRSAPGSAAYNTAMAVRLRFDPDAAALRAALQALLVRHPCLRTTFSSGPDGSLEPVQHVHAWREVALEEVDATGWAAEELRARVRDANRRPFDLERGPVLRATLFRCGARDHVLLVSIHHIVCDGWSMWLLMDELWSAYAAGTGQAGAVALPERIPALLDTLGEPLRAPAPGSCADGAAGAAALDGLVRRALRDVLAGIGALDVATPRDALRARLGIQPRYLRLFDALLDLAAGDGAATPGDPPPGGRPAAGGLGDAQQALARAFPEYGAYVDLTAACLAALPDVLAGRRSAMEVLFPGGSMDLVERTYRGNPVADFYNGRIAALVVAYVVERRRRDPAAVVEVIEVGAGTGGTSAAVLEAVRRAGLGDAVRYRYTDVSPAFARHGEREFGERYPFVRFETLDLERDPLAQGFEAGGADLILGSHVLHATRRIDVTLRNVKALLRRSGLLVLNELTRAQAFLTVTFGLMDGWWVFEDAEARLPGSPLLDLGRWRAALERHGFAKVRHLGLSEEGADGGSPQTVLAAESDGVLPARQGAHVSSPGGTYEAFVRAQRALLGTPEAEAHWVYWRRQLAPPLPVLDLPLDRERPALQTHDGGWVPFRIPPELARALRGFAAARNVTLYGVLLAAYELLLHRYGGQDDLVVGCPTAGRHDRSWDRVVGHFVNTLPIRADLSGDPTVEELVARTRAALLGALEHQAYPFPALVERLRPERDPGRTPVFQTLFVFQEPPQELALADVVTDFYSGNARATLHGLDFESFPVSQQEGQFDLSMEVTGAGDSLKGVLKFNERLFDRSTVDRMSRHFLALLRGLIAQPGDRAGSVPLLGEDERQLVVERWNDTARDWVLEPVHALFEARARAAPDAPALIHGGQVVRYGELEGRANQLARHLVSRGVALGEPVGVAVERSPELIVAVLGVLKAGGAYVPLDPAYPSDRLAFMIEDAAVRVVVASDGIAAGLPVSPERTVRLGADGPAIAAEDAGPLALRGDAASLAYVLYTSGSTGRPKGVAMPHGPLCNLIRWQNETSCVPAGRTLQLTTLNFDVSFQEIFATLSSGGTLVLVREELRLDPEGLLRLMHDAEVERVFLPFVLLKLLAEAAEGGASGGGAPLPTRLREVVTAGEQLRVTPAIAALFRRLEGCRLVNQYGPTEAHVVTSHPLTGPPEAWPHLPPIGRPIANARIHVVDAALQPVPPGIAGELVIGGACVARGYHRRPEETARRFVPDPFGRPGDRLYRTGDLARLRHDGAIEYLGRADQQVKIRGFRVEPAEIEKLLQEHPAVSEAVVACDEDAAGDRRLCAYYVPRAPVDVPALRAHLGARLPAYMVPAAYVELSALPLTPNGKVDRRALPRPAAPAPSQVHVAPRDAIEASVSALCRAVLKLEALGVEDDLFAAGATSLSTLALQRAIDRAFPGRITVPDLVRYPTVARLAAVLRERAGAQAQAPTRKSEQYRRLLGALAGEQGG